MCTVSGPIICIENTALTPIVPGVPAFNFVTGIRTLLWRVQHKNLRATTAQRPSSGRRFAGSPLLASTIRSVACIKRRQGDFGGCVPFRPRSYALTTRPQLRLYLLYRHCTLLRTFAHVFRASQKTSQRISARQDREPVVIGLVFGRFRRVCGCRTSRCIR